MNFHPCIGLVHATLAPVEAMAAAVRRSAPRATILHFMDEGLLPLVERDGITPAALDAIGHLVKRAEASGAHGVLLTCSVYSPAVPQLQTRVRVPVLSADEAMLRAALAQGRCIGVVATVATAGPITAKLLGEYAAETGQEVLTEIAVTTEAFDALKAGDGGRHDALVRKQIERLLPRVDVLVLAQISMARAVDNANFTKPVLTSPEASIRALLARLEAVG
jgi:Asp/Glu/hydantoin racemase